METRRRLCEAEEAISIILNTISAFRRLCLVHQYPIMNDVEAERPRCIDLFKFILPDFINQHWNFGEGMSVTKIHGQDNALFCGLGLIYRDFFFSRIESRGGDRPFICSMSFHNVDTQEIDKMMHFIEEIMQNGH